MKTKTERLYNRIYAPARLTPAALIVTIGAFAIDTYTMLPTFQSLVQYHEGMIKVLVLGMALAMEASPNILALLLKKRDKAPLDFLMMLIAVVIFLMVSAANLIVKLGTIKQMFSDTEESSYVLTESAAAAGAFKATPAMVSFTIALAIVPVMTSVLVFAIGVAQDTALIEHKKRLAFLKAASEDMGRIEAELAALDQEPGAGSAADAVRAFFAEERRLCDTICGQLIREADHLIAARVPDRAEALTNLQGRKTSGPDPAGPDPGPEDEAVEGGCEEYSEASPEDIPEEEFTDFGEEDRDPFREDGGDGPGEDFFDDPDEEEEIDETEVSEEGSSGSFHEKVPGERYPDRHFRVIGEKYPDEYC